MLMYNLNAYRLMGQFLFNSSAVSQHPNLIAARTRDGWQHRLIACLALRAAADAVAALSLRRRHPYSIRARAN